MEIVQHDLKIPEVYQGLLKTSSSISLEIDGEVVLDTINDNALVRQVCCTKCGIINLKATGKIYIQICCKSND